MARYTSLRDMFDGGGPGQSGDTFSGAVGRVSNAVGLTPVSSNTDRGSGAVYQGPTPGGSAGYRQDPGLMGVDPATGFITSDENRFTPVAPMSGSPGSSVSSGGDGSSGATATTSSVSSSSGAPVRFIYGSRQTSKHPLTGQTLYTQVVTALDDQGNIVDQYRTSPQNSRERMNDEARRYQAQLMATQTGSPQTVRVNYGSESVTLNPGGSMSDPYRATSIGEDGSLRIRTVDNRGIRVAPTVVTDPGMISPDARTSTVDITNLLPSLGLLEPGSTAQAPTQAPTQAMASPGMDMVQPAQAAAPVIAPVQLAQPQAYVAPTIGSTLAAPTGPLYASEMLSGVPQFLQAGALPSFAQPSGQYLYQQYLGAPTDPMQQGIMSLPPTGLV